MKKEIEKNQAIVLGVLAIWPLIYLIVFIVLVSAFIFYPQGLEPFFIWIALFHGITMIMIIAQVIYYIYRIMSIEKFKESEKVLWIITIMFANAFALPVYWYLHIWKKLK